MESGLSGEIALEAKFFRILLQVYQKFDLNVAKKFSNFIEWKREEK
jgi:hypothetical protein